MYYKVETVVGMVSGADIPWISEEGVSETEALESCLKRVRTHISLWARLTGGTLIPLSEIKNLPDSLPDEHALLIFEQRCAETKSISYRHFAVIPEKFLLRGVCPAKKLPIPGHESIFGVGGRQNDIVTLMMDSTSPERLPLPAGSMEYVNGEWLSRDVLEYA